ncbi:MAG TPA: site-specific DNA-methyltransferase [Candidatus Acidoferrum sp.]|nr:site-specific DNA-methyltransferase [Candidatus Acidoferrum sp.]
MTCAAPAPVLDIAGFVPPELRELADPQRDLPRIARDPQLVAAIEANLRSFPTRHQLMLQDARYLSSIEAESVHLVVTSPPYWTLKEYRESAGQMGSISDYQHFLLELEKVWRNCFHALVPGGRLVCVVGDVCLSRRRNNGRHTVVPLHASIQEQCRKIGFDNLAPIIWYKISNAAYEVENGSSFLGKPYEPNAVIKNDVEFILMQRKPGGYRSPSVHTRVLSVISAENYQKWFQQVWNGVTGASTKEHPAPFPTELAERLVRMFSFVGDTVLDPFMGTGTTTVAAARWGRNSIGVEVDEHYFNLAQRRISTATGNLFGTASVQIAKAARKRK